MQLISIQYKSAYFLSKMNEVSKTKLWCGIGKIVNIGKRKKEFKGYYCSKYLDCVLHASNSLHELCACF